MVLEKNLEMRLMIIKKDLKSRLKLRLSNYFINSNLFVFIILFDLK